MKNWKTNLGGAISVLGTSLIGMGIIPQLGEAAPNAVLKWVVVTGFILSAIGKAITALFSADASEVRKLSDQVNNIEPKP